MTKRKNLAKKIIVLITALTMILTIGLLAACDIGGLTLEQRMTSLETAVTQLEEQAPTMENGALLAEIQRLQGDASALRNEAATNGKTARLQTVEARLTSLYNGAENGGNSVKATSTCQRFSIEVSIDKTRVTVGETIAISAVFRNLTDQYITIELLDHIANRHKAQLLQGELQHLIEIALLPYGEYPDIEGILFDGVEIVLPPEAMTERTVEVSANVVGDHWVLVSVAFFVGENRQERILVGIPPVRVYITQTKGGHN